LNAGLALNAAAGTPSDVYGSRVAARRSELSVFEKSGARAGYGRLIAIGAALLIGWAIVEHAAPAWTLALPIAGFIALVAWQSRIDRGAQCVKRAIGFYERGLARVENRWRGSGETGERFSDPHHPYASDLDLFGRASLFELLSTARTRGGEARLASWLKKGASIGDLRMRHEAIRELQPMLDWREEIAVLGEDIRSGVNADQLAAWAAAPPSPFPAWMRILALAFAIFAAFALLWVFGTGFVNVNARRALLLTALVEGAFFALVRNRVRATVDAINEPARDLDVLAELLATLERRRFQSERLVSLRAAIDIEGWPASRRIARLRRWVELLDSRDNLALRVIGPLLLWTPQAAMGIENWRAKNGRFIAGWLEAVSELEALSALANYAWEHPADPFPEFEDAGLVFDGEDLAHPLIPAERAVANSVRLSIARTRVLVVSGSNMSGKSTLLRTVGVNTVLALAGAPVRGRRLVLTPAALGASIRNVDSLEEGQSRFMAEILRLKQILELPTPALFLLDELLHGTNSHDRAIGSEGLLRALLERGFIGLVTTHDLSLARVAAELAPAAENVHFEDRLENGRLRFDYRMRPGVVERSNALDLMRAVGLEV
jgi:hypothetical protein